MAFGALPHYTRLAVNTDVVLQRALLASAGNDAGIFHFRQWFDGMGECDLTVIAPGNFRLDDAVASIKNHDAHVMPPSNCIQMFTDSVYDCLHLP